ncbi:hypothetical protein [uncultured Draconibacterium sp.]|uniref:hypothetical protein n=1 Tax=uncultured Draconibacterium sp. TaxID=1573823 RepID=UPI002AA812DE|nr:hypothetical protein [uncultured Draconibacterium sp.]
MKVKSSSIRITILSSILLNFLTLFAFGQTEDSTKMWIPQTGSSSNIVPAPLIPVTENIQFNRELLFSPDNNQQSRFSVNDWQLSKPDVKHPQIKLEQSTTVNIFPNLGQSNQFSGNLNYQLSDKVRIDLGMGLYQQNTILSPWNINYQLGVTSTIEYSFNSWLSAYIYGQYISPSLTQNNFFDPLQYMNPLFKHTEFGGGLRAKYKSIKADVGMKNIMGADLNEKRSTGYFQSKISLGF